LVYAQPLTNDNGSGLPIMIIIDENSYKNPIKIDEIKKNGIFQTSF